MTNGAIALEQAKFNVMQNGQVSSTVPVQFNPASLQYTIENTLSEPTKDGVQRQYVTQSSGKLTMDILLDTTDSGQDVRSQTEQVAQLMQPVNDGSNKNIPPVVQFEWGAYKFTGMMTSYKETIDFFAANGVPLRAAINLTIASQTDVFQETDPNNPQSAVVTPTASSASATSVASAGGDPAAARALASQNGLASMRFTGGAQLAIGAGVSLQGPVAFATGSAGVGIGAGVGVSAGLSVSAGAGISVGGQASAGVSATAGAFAGLRVSTSGATSASTATLNVNRIRSQVSISGPSVSAGAQFGLGGVALQTASPGLSANVGAGVTLGAALEFGD